MSLTAYFLTNKGQWGTSTWPITDNHYLKMLFTDHISTVQSSSMSNQATTGIKYLAMNVVRISVFVFGFQLSFILCHPSAS